MKRIISLVMVVVFLISVPVMVNAVTDEQKAELKELGIMVGDENGDLRLNDTITRAEVIKMICVAGSINTENQEELTFSVEPETQSVYKYPDVSETHWAYQYIKSAKAYGIIEGDENGNFNPENNVTNEEVIKMVVALLGYSPMADTIGGYPAGYTATATRIGLTKDMQFAVDVPAIRGDVAKIICNALDTPLMVQAGMNFSTQNAEYKIMDGKNGVDLMTLRKNINESI